MTRLAKTGFVCPKCLNTRSYWDGEDMVECEYCEDIEFFDDFTNPDFGDWINDVDDEEFGNFDSD